MMSTTRLGWVKGDQDGKKKHPIQKKKNPRKMPKASNPRWKEKTLVMDSHGKTKRSDFREGKSRGPRAK